MRYLILLLSLLSIDTLAQTNFDLFQYRYVGPTRGGRVTAVAGVTSQPNTFYFGATGGGVWKSEDYGVSWKNVSDGYFETPSIGAIRVAQNDPNIIYVGTGTDGLRSNLIVGKGVYKSIDAGKSWKHIGLKKVGQIGAVEIHPQDHNTVFVAAIGQAFQRNQERGVYRTKDGGKNWKQVLAISDTTGFVDLEFMPTNPNIIYASAWRAERKPWTIISGGKENGIYRSLDGGDTWNRVGEGLPKLMGKIDLAVSPDDSKVVYALVEAPAEVSGLYRSDDHGENFVHISNEYGLSDRPFYYCNVDTDPNDVETVYVNSTRYYKSTNGGKSWQKLGTPHGDNHDMWINPNDSDLYIQANDGGANVTHNGGKTWSSQYNQPTAELYQVEVDNQHPYYLYAGQQDNSTTIAVPSAPPTRHQAGAIGFVVSTGGCETGPAVPNPDNPNIVYSNCKGRFSVFNKLTGQAQEHSVGARNMYGHNPKDLKFRFQRVAPIHVSPHDSKVVYHTSQYVHKTTDEGKTWEIISPDLTAFEADKQMRSGSPITNDITGEEFYSTIYAIRESKVKQGVIWVGANDGPVHVTQNSGENWTQVTPKILAKGGRVDCVEPSPHDAAKAYFSVLRYQLGDWKPYIFKTENYGKSWILLTDGNNGIPNDYPVRVVREDPVKAGILYAGTEYGMFISLDDGKSWEAFQQNLPVTPITDLKIHRGDLVLSTMGRGFYILDNISALRQNYSTLDKTAIQLFQPKDTYRYRYYPMNVGSETQPNYPAPSVMIDYYLPEDIDSTFLLHIKNADGKVIRTFAPKKLSQAEVTQRNMSTETFTYSVNSSLKKTKGFHRFRWDMRHAGAWDNNSKRAYQNGPMVAPNSYTVVLETNQETHEQSFQLLADPRVLSQGVSLEHLQEQEALALQIIDLYSAAKKKAHEIEEHLKKVKKDSKEYQVLTTQKDQLVQAQGRYTQPKLLSQIRYLYYILASSDMEPSRDVRERLEELRGVLGDLNF
ncbi:MAG: hypothetical protein AAGG68_22750 [Bacteroidota bacterium]